MIFWLSAISDQLSGRRRQSGEVGDHEELTQFEPGQHDAATEVSDVVFVSVTDPFHETALDA